jgi:Helix-turn-helix domain
VTKHEPSAVAPARKQGQSPRHEWREYVAREVKKLPAPVRGLLAQLYDRMDYRGECWASNEKLADELDVTPRSVRNYIAGARERGLLDVVMTDCGRVFRAAIPGDSNVAPIRRGRQVDAGGWNVVSTKAGSPASANKDEAGLQPSSYDEAKSNGGRLEEPEAPRRPSNTSVTSKRDVEDLGACDEKREWLDWLETLEQERDAEPESFALWRPLGPGGTLDVEDAPRLAWLDDLEHERDTVVPSAVAQTVNTQEVR